MTEVRKALVTGGSRGIGRAVSLRLARNGFEVWVNYKSRDAEAKETKRLIESAGGTCRLIKLDVSDREQVRSVLGPLLEQAGGVDALVNNAGIAKDNLFAWLTDEEWDQVLATNLGGFYNVTKAVVPLMIPKGWGRIVSIVSISGERGNRGQSNYAAAKAGIIAATRSLAQELARQGILVNAVSPGLIETEMTTSIEIPKAELKRLIPSGRYGTPEEVASAVAFLCSDDASYIVGQVLRVNGGLHL